MNLKNIPQLINQHKRLCSALVLGVFVLTLSYRVSVIDATKKDLEEVKASAELAVERKAEKPKEEVKEEEKEVKAAKGSYTNPYNLKESFTLRTLRNPEGIEVEVLESGSADKLDAGWTYTDLVAKKGEDKDTTDPKKQDYIREETKKIDYIKVKVTNPNEDFAQTSLFDCSFVKADGVLEEYSTIDGSHSGKDKYKEKSYIDKKVKPAASAELYITLPNGYLEDVEMLYFNNSDYTDLCVKVK